MKKVYQEVKVHPVDLKAGKLRVENGYCFRSLDFLAINWQVTADGRVIEQGCLEPVAVPPGESRGDNPSLYRSAGGASLGIPPAR